MITEDLIRTQFLYLFREIFQNEINIKLEVRIENKYIDALIEYNGLYTIVEFKRDINKFQDAFIQLTKYFSVMKKTYKIVNLLIVTNYTLHLIDVDSDEKFTFKESLDWRNINQKKNKETIRKFIMKNLKENIFKSVDAEELVEIIDYDDIVENDYKLLSPFNIDGEYIIFQRLVVEYVTKDSSKKTFGLSMSLLNKLLSSVELKDITSEKTKEGKKFIIPPCRKTICKIKKRKLKQFSNDWPSGTKCDCGIYYYLIDPDMRERGFYDPANTNPFYNAKYKKSFP